MPMYEYDCAGCGRRSTLLVRGASRGETPACPHCGDADLRRAVSGFAFHKSLQSKAEQLDPKYDKMLDAVNPDLSSEALTRRYGLDRPMTAEQKRQFRRKTEESSPGS
jgi:putative FmdB family regulatory protein